MCRSMEKDMEAWKRANPYRLVNVSSIGTLCGRAASLDDAKRQIASMDGEFVGVSGTQVFFSQKILL